MRITLGGHTVDLLHPGLNHSDDATVMLFHDERVVSATEFLADALVTTNPRSLPSACGAFRSYRAVEALDFDRVAPWHGIRAGRPLAELVETITLDRYRGWANYERLRRMNVEAEY